MYKSLVCALVLFSSTCLCKDEMLDKTELILAFMTHRHGDRTPVQETIHFASDLPNVLEKTVEYGFGQLTDKGKARGYELGKFIRRRYGSYLSEKYNRSEIYIRSTDSTRTKMTVLAAMAAVYPPCDDNWSKKINWTPVPYTTLRAKYDSMLAIVNCPVVMNTTKSKFREPVPAMAKYKRLLEDLSEILGINLQQMPASLYMIYDTFLSQISLGVPLNPLLDHLLPEMQEAAGLAIDYVFGDEKYLPLQAGVLLKDFFDAVDSVVTGKDIPKIHIYSAHDVNVYTFSAVSKVMPRIGVPKYGSLFSLELRRDIKTGQYFIVPVFLKEPGADETYMQVKGCEGFCDLETFRKLTSDYIRTEGDYRKECGFSADFDFDTSSID